MSRKPWAYFPKKPIRRAPGEPTMLDQLKDLGMVNRVTEALSPETTESRPKISTQSDSFNQVEEFQPIADVIPIGRAKRDSEE